MSTNRKSSAPWWAWALGYVVLAFALGFLVGRANYYKLPFSETVRFLGLYFNMVLLACLCLLMTGLAIRLALLPRPHRAMTEWHKMPWQTAVVIRLTDQGLWIGCLCMAAAALAGLLSPDTLRALLPFGG